MARELASNELRTGRVRISYAHVHEPKAPRGSTKAVYSGSILIQKTDAKTLADLKKCVEAAIVLGVEKCKGWNGKRPDPSILVYPWHDGDKERKDDENYKGVIFLNAKSERKPGLMDNGTPPQPITNPDDFYSGCYIRAFLSFYAYEFMGKKGIGVGLQHLQKVDDGPRLSGGVNAEDAFSDWGGSAESVEISF